VLKRDGKSILSVLVRNRFGEVLKAAIKCNDAQLAKRALVTETVLDSLYQEPVRLFDPADLRDTMEQAGFKIVAERGVRVISDYLGRQALTGDEYKQLLELELLLGAKAQFAAVARYTQIIACLPSQPGGGKRK
jgi:hypothetical protein